MPELLTHCGAERCKIEQLLAIPEPKQTETYTPLNHYDFAVNVKTVASNMLRDFPFAKEAYALSSNGNKMFGVLSYASKSTSDNDPLRLSIGIRNSHDTSISCGVAVGTSVIVLDNLMFKGDVTVLRKHTGKKMHEQLMDQVVTAIYKSQCKLPHLLDHLKERRFSWGLFNLSFIQCLFITAWESLRSVRLIEILTYELNVAVPIYCRPRSERKSGSNQ